MASMGLLHRVAAAPASRGPLAVAGQLAARRQVSTVGRRQVSTVGVVGAGQMGNGIAMVSVLNAKTNCVLYDPSPAQLAKAVPFIQKQLDRGVSKGKWTEEESAAAIGRLTVADELSGLSAADFVVEAATEDVELKLKLFADMDAVVGPEAILSTNTSSISITKIGAATSRPEKVIGMHFMNPVPVMKLVEVIKSLATSDETMATTLTLAADMGKTTAVAKDVPGFIANRLLLPYINEAVFALAEGIGSAEDIDTVRFPPTHPSTHPPTHPSTHPPTPVSTACCSNA